MEIIRQFFVDKIKNSGLKQSYVAEKANINPDLLSRMLNGTRKIQADEFFVLCRALNARQDVLQGSSQDISQWCH